MSKIKRKIKTTLYIWRLILTGEGLGLGARILNFFSSRKRNLSDLWFEIRWQYVERFTDKDPHMELLGQPELTHNGPEDGVY